jgi:hypothetical protein
MEMVYDLLKMNFGFEGEYTFNTKYFFAKYIMAREPYKITTNLTAYICPKPNKPRKTPLGHIELATDKDFELLSSYLEETDIHRDYIHATDLGRVIASYTWYCKLMGIEKLEEIKLSGKNLKFIPFAREALVFYVNKSNSISSLSVEEIGRMYNGDIESWEKIGGKNNEIITFQLMKNNGSQTSFEDIVKNNNINEKHMEANDMISIIQKVIHNKNGIGYAFNSFYTQQFNSSMLKLIEINGVKPSNYNIISGIYPLMHDIYFVYDENNSNESIKILENWVLSENCQSLCESLGFQRIN